MRRTRRLARLLLREAERRPAERIHREAGLTRSRKLENRGRILGTPRIPERVREPARASF
jgi:hypothetical protein